MVLCPSRVLFPVPLVLTMYMLAPVPAALSCQVVVEDAAFDAGLAIRTGCMCNPGQCQFNLGIQPEEVRGGYGPGTA